jgi:hypothetical protein
MPYTKNYALLNSSEEPPIRHVRNPRKYQDDLPACDQGETAESSATQNLGIVEITMGGRIQPTDNTYKKSSYRKIPVYSRVAG